MAAQSRGPAVLQPVRRFVVVQRQPSVRRVGRKSFLKQPLYRTFHMRSPFASLPFYLLSGSGIRQQIVSYAQAY
jgi:hypothetical protein